MTSAPKQDPRTLGTAMFGRKRSDGVLLLDLRGLGTYDPNVAQVLSRFSQTTPPVADPTQRCRRLPHQRWSHQQASVFTSQVRDKRNRVSAPNPAQRHRRGSHQRRVRHLRSRALAAGLAILLLGLLLLVPPPHRAQAVAPLAAGKPSASWHEVDVRPMGGTTHVKPPPSPPRTIGTWISREKDQTARAEALMSQHRASKVPRV